MILDDSSSDPSVIARSKASRCRGRQRTAIQFAVGLLIVMILGAFALSAVEKVQDAADRSR